LLHQVERTVQHRFSREQSDPMSTFRGHVHKERFTNPAQRTSPLTRRVRLNQLTCPSSLQHRRYHPRIQVEIVAIFELRIAVKLTREKRRRQSAKPGTNADQAGTRKQAPSRRCTPRIHVHDENRWICPCLPYIGCVNEMSMAAICPSSVGCPAEKKRWTTQI